MEPQLSDSYRIRVEQLRLTFEQQMTTLPGFIVAVGLMMIIIWHNSDIVSISYWLIFVAITIIVRVHANRTYKRLNSDQVDTVFWTNYTLITCTLSGFVWGYIPLFLFNGKSETTILLIVLLISGIISSITITLSYLRRFIFSYLSIALFPITLRLIFLESENSIIILSFTVIYYIIVVSSIKRNYEVLHASITSKFGMERNAQELQDSQQRLVMHLEQTPLGAIEWTTNYRVVDWNHSAEKIFGYTKEEAFNIKAKQLVTPSYWPLLRDEWETAGKTKKGHTVQIENIRKDGKKITCQWHGTPLLDRLGKVIGHASFVADITESNRQEETIRHQALFDGLTGLPNRRAMQDRLHQVVSQHKRYGGHFAIYFIDLDHFKDINDTQGHQFGDQVLCQFSNRIRSILRTEESLGRFGGDEFILLIEKLSRKLERAENQAAVVAQNIIQQNNTEYLIQKTEISLSCSIGVYLSDSHSQDSANEILRKADLALYSAKNSGRGRFTFYDKKMNSDAMRFVELQNGLRKAIINNEFSLRYQPKVFVNNDNLAGAEVLLRWLHPAEGYISPVEFIPILETSGQIVDVGHWVLEQSFMQLKQWLDDDLWDRNSRLSINISPRQLLEPDFPKNVEDLLSKFDLMGENLDFEITENVLLNDSSEVINALDKLNQLKIHLSIDDFGTGYSSLAYLKRLPLSVLKIDRSFIQEIETNCSDLVLVKTMLGICQGLGLTSVAEGVENEKQLELLSNMNCHVYQGYLFSKPITADQFQSLLHNTDN